MPGTVTQHVHSRQRARAVEPLRAPGDFILGGRVVTLQRKDQLVDRPSSAPAKASQNYQLRAATCAEQTRSSPDQIGGYLRTSADQAKSPRVM